MKVFIVGRRAPHTTREAAQRHLLAIHGPMVVLAPPEAGPMPSPYVQNHVRDGAYPVDAMSFPREIDLVTEINFVDRAEMEAALDTPYYRENLAPDELRFVETATVVRLPIAETHESQGAAGAFKLIALVLAGADVAAVASAFSKAADGRRFRRHRVIPGAAPCLAVLEGWAANQSDALTWGEAVPADAAVILAAAEFTADTIRGLME